MKTKGARSPLRFLTRFAETARQMAPSRTPAGTNSKRVLPDSDAGPSVYSKHQAKLSDALAHEFAKADLAHIRHEHALRKLDAADYDFNLMTAELGEVLPGGQAVRPVKAQEPPTASMPIRGKVRMHRVTRKPRAA